MHFINISDAQCINKGKNWFVWMRNEQAQEI